MDWYFADFRVQQIIKIWATSEGTKCAIPPSEQQKNSDTPINFAAPPLFPVLNDMLRLSSLQRVLNRDKIFWEILSSAPKVPFARGVWMHDPQEILKSRGSKYAISGVLTQQFVAVKIFW